MSNKNDKIEGLELLPCSFKFHDFVAEVGEVRISCQIMKMEESLYLWIGDFNNSKMNDLSFALISSYEKLPISTQLMGSLSDVTSANIAKRLAKRIGKPVYVSFNLQPDNLSLPGIEKRIQKELNNNPELLGF